MSLKLMVKRFIRAYRSNLCCKNRNATMVEYAPKDVVRIFDRPHWRGTIVMKCHTCGDTQEIDGAILPDAPPVGVIWNTKHLNGKELEECL